MATKLKYHKNNIELPLAQNVIPVKIGIKQLINQALYMLEEQKYTSIILLAYHQTSTNAILISKILKEKFPKLHEITAIKTIEKFYHYEPLEEGLVDVNISVKIPSIIIKLTFHPTQEEMKNPGYQRCLFDERIEKQNIIIREVSYVNEKNQEEEEDDNDWGQIDDDHVDKIEDRIDKIEDQRKYIVQKYLK